MILTVRSTLVPEYAFKTAYINDEIQFESHPLRHHFFLQVILIATFFYVNSFNKSVPESFRFSPLRVNKFRNTLKAVKRMEQVSIVRHGAMTGRTVLEGKPAIPHNVGLIPEGKENNAPGNEMRPSHDRRIINQGDTCRRVV